MGIFDRLSRRWPKSAPLQVLPRGDWARQRPTYRDADPLIIEGALQRCLRRPSGNWYPFAASAWVRADRPFGTSVAGTEVVAWRDGSGALRVGPGACPHLGAELATGTVDRGALVCPWHGLRLAGFGDFGWKPLPSYDDGVLVWVRLDRVGGEEPTERPVIGPRPDGSTLAAVTRLVGTCEPRDIIANRLDPWHGAWFHPYSFSCLEVLAAPPPGATVPLEADRFLVAVTFRMGRFGVPVIAEFSSPERRTIVMRIVDGEGAGSVVETHAVPVGSVPVGSVPVGSVPVGSVPVGSVVGFEGRFEGRPRTAVLEAVVAHSDRSGFGATSRLAPLITPLMRYAATRLWRDDLAYAERRYALRARVSG